MVYDMYTLRDLLDMRDAYAILKKYKVSAIEEHHKVCEEIELRVKNMEGAGVGR